jgi:hypothetical protein
MAAPDPPAAVTEAGDFACSHDGERKLTDLGSGKLTVGGDPVLLVDAASSGSYAGCVFVDPSTNQSRPCNSSLIITDRVAKLTVASTAVLLTSDKVTSLNVDPPPTPPAPVTVTPGQAKLTAR